jgi:tripartite-type tricarboxylate transporter receptor subunit TctC
VSINKAAGVPDQECNFITGLVAPAGTAKDIVDRLNNELDRTLNEPDVVERLRINGYTAQSSTPEAFAELIKTQIARWGKIIRDSKMPRVE